MIPRTTTDISKKGSKAIATRKGDSHTQGQCTDQPDMQGRFRDDAPNIAPATAHLLLGDASLLPLCR